MVPGSWKLEEKTNKLTEKGDHGKYGEYLPNQLDGIGTVIGVDVEHYEEEDTAEDIAGKDQNSFNGSNKKADPYLNI